MLNAELADLLEELHVVRSRVRKEMNTITKVVALARA